MAGRASWSTWTTGDALKCLSEVGDVAEVEAEVAGGAEEEGGDFSKKATVPRST